MSGINLPTILLQIPRNSVVAVGLPLALGMLSGYPTAQVVRGSWYKNLYVPPGRLPPQVFPVVWPILYIAMGYASHVAVKALDTTLIPSHRADIKLGLALYYAQFALNVAWSPLFFGSQKIGLALVDSVLLAGTTWYMTSLLDGPTNHKATYFLAPYCAWVGFATYLNGGIWWLNRDRTTVKGL